MKNYEKENAKNDNLKKVKKQKNKENSKPKNIQEQEKIKHKSLKKKSIKKSKEISKTSIIKSGIISLELISLLIVGKLSYDILTKPVVKTYEVGTEVICTYENPWILVYNEEGIEQGKKNNTAYYEFQTTDTKPNGSLLTEVHFYTTKEAYENDKDFCNTQPFGQLECIEDATELTRTVKVKNIYYGEVPEEGPYDIWYKEYIDELGKGVYDCKIKSAK